MGLKRALHWRWLKLMEMFGAPPPHRRKHEFAIAVGKCASPLKWEFREPQLTRLSCPSYPALFVADPFIVQAEGGWHLFFEIMNWKSHKGVVGHATSPDCDQWTYHGLVLEEPYHLSYPYVFEHEGTWYMTPEGLEGGGVRLYKAAPFPSKWEFVTELIPGVHADPTLFRDGDTWYLFSCPRFDDHDELRLYWAEDLMGPWTEHPASPVVTGDNKRARPAGKLIRYQGQLYRFAQDCDGAYGLAVRALRVTELSRTAYHEEEIESSPVLKGSGAGWNAHGMHQIDAHEMPDGSWMVCVDGWERIVDL